MTESTITARNFWIHALSPIHVGTGRGVGYIDLPIAREKVTNWPYIPGSSIKGVIADHHDASDSGNRRSAGNLKKAAFGIAGDDNSTAGSLVFTDARLVCLPVQSIYGTFAWTTSPLVLGSLVRDLSWNGLYNKKSVPQCSERTALIPAPSALVGETERKIYLQDLDIDARTSEETRSWAETIAAWIFGDDKIWQDTFVERFVILPDNIFSYLCEMGTQVDARIKIDPDKGTVKNGGLWYEEALPAESILAGMVWCDRVYVPQISPEELFNTYCSGNHFIQIGGKATTGRGRVTLTFADAGEKA